ncbi:hypothetical protein METBIDRAFT_224688 [Metschnikowia bicuspidata var. bicuspidata NRRL YB-4993]|uniref:ATPase expression protein 1 n=1 Tax=Metschnikowia bicuspidata var. bicuspidata NRRL YB-4993 TaxID=869754 RepID=A0A1A0H4S8_9ASCO|nr:hypothetical protein METBIDRAFT_224688 [Metschnikowia bicuspidata var. bicuspidata NRRL YB-4993]OBA19041.1 hypothetical protein METBIDRAFT_224688 [Metschnikowia bicuspidata var. bicuspidata NRRL YB-4993]
MVQSTRLLVRVYKNFARKFGHSVISAKDPVSFYPTASFLDNAAHEQRMKENEAAVPTRPSLQSVKHIYRDMVLPQDVCDLLWEPKTEDYVITSLAEDCALNGDSLHKIVSRSPVSETKLMFANIAISWLDKFKAQTLQLSELTGLEEQLLYNKPLQIISSDYTEDCLSSAENLKEFCDLLLKKGYSLESITQFILSSHTTLAQYKYILGYLCENMYVLNPVSISEFTGYIITDAYKRHTSNEKELLGYSEAFDCFLRERLLQVYPSSLRAVGAITLDKLAYLSSVSENFQTAIMTLTDLIQQHKTAPSKSTWGTFFAAYSKYAVEQDLLKSQILAQISALKPVIFHHRLTAHNFRFLLSKVVDNSHDLSHLVQLVQTSSPDILVECGGQVIKKLQQISNASNASSIVKAVQATQLSKALEAAGFQPN